MHILRENQVKVLKLYSKGKQRNEICKILSLRRSSVDEAIRRGLENISAAIEVLRFALENNILNEQKSRGLELILTSLKFSEPIQDFLSKSAFECLLICCIAKSWSIYL